MGREPPTLIAAFSGSYGSYPTREAPPPARRARAAPGRPTGARRPAPCSRRAPAAAPPRHSARACPDRPGRPRRVDHRPQQMPLVLDRPRRHPHQGAGLAEGVEAICNLAFGIWHCAPARPPGSAPIGTRQSEIGNPLDQLPAGRIVRDGGRRAAGHGLDGQEAEALALGRRDAQIRQIVQLRQLARREGRTPAALAGEDHAVGDAVDLACQMPEVPAACVGVRGGAGVEDELDVAGQPRQRVEQQRELLAPLIGVARDQHEVLGPQRCAQPPAPAPPQRQRVVHRAEHAEIHAVRDMVERHAAFEMRPHQLEAEA